MIYIACILTFFLGVLLGVFVLMVFFNRERELEAPFNYTTFPVKCVYCGKTFTGKLKQPVSGESN